MKVIFSIFFLIFTISASLLADNVKEDREHNGKKVFETYCWGCHHQTAVAFGPSFAQIAAQRNAEEIRAMIIDPKAVSKVLGYKRNAMPAFTLSEEELKTISAYIMSFRNADTNISEERNGTTVEEPYPNIAVHKEMK